MTVQPKLFPGDPAPWFHARASTRPDYAFDQTAGRYVVMTFLAAGSAVSRAVLRALDGQRAIFDDVRARWFIVTNEARDEEPGMLPGGLGVRHLYDTDGAVDALYAPRSYGQHAVTFVLSPRLQVIAIIGDENGPQHAQRLRSLIDSLPPIEGLMGSFGGPPPILVIPSVFEPAFCKLLIEGYERDGGEPSGFMRDEGGRTMRKFDNAFKVRRDWEVKDKKLQEAIGARFVRRVVPEIKRGYNFTVTHLERQLVACYDAAEGGHFAAHRDNTAKGTAHRRFACTVNLNADYEGGDLTFPEFGPQTYRAPIGGCVIFGASLLHQANKVMQGRRYAFLPFLHDADAEKERAANAGYIDLGESAA